MQKYRAIVTIRNVEILVEANNIDDARDLVIEGASDLIDPTVQADIDIELIEDID